MRNKKIDFFITHSYLGAGSRGYETFFVLNQLSTKFQLHIKTKIQTNEAVIYFKSLRCCIYHANKCQNAIFVGIFNIYEQYKFHALLS